MVLKACAFWIMDLENISAIIALIVIALADVFHSLHYLIRKTNKSSCQASANMEVALEAAQENEESRDRKSTRLNSSH